jgi:plastocyanin
MLKTLKTGALALALSLGAVGAAAVCGPGAAQAAAPAGPTVKIDNFVFGPDTLTVSVGTTVTWINQDDIPHTVVASDKHTFKSKVLDSDERFSFTFTKPGEFGYFCSLHPHMVGKVIVKAA